MLTAVNDASRRLSRRPTAIIDRACARCHGAFRSGRRNGPSQTKKLTLDPLAAIRELLITNSVFPLVARRTGFSSPTYSANLSGSRQKCVGHSCPTHWFQHEFGTEMPGVGVFGTKRLQGHTTCARASPMILVRSMMAGSCSLIGAASRCSPAEHRQVFRRAGSQRQVRSDPRRLARTQCALQAGREHGERHLPGPVIGHWPFNGKEPLIVVGDDKKERCGLFAHGRPRAFFQAAAKPGTTS